MGDGPEDKRGGESEGDHPTSSIGSSSSSAPTAGDQGGQILTAKVVDGSQQPSEEDGGAPEVPPTPEELMAEVKLLKATVEAQRKSLEMLAGQKEEVETLKKRLERAQKIFGSEWDRKHEQWEWLASKLQVLEEEQAELEKMVGLLKKSLAQKSREISLKLEQIQLLTKLSSLKAKGMKWGKVEANMSTMSTTLMKPVEDAGMVGVVARRDAVEILPEEVWKMILGNVTDPKDLWNLCNSCLLFDTILSKWKTGWLLEQALPYLYRYLPGEKLLGCRLICKSWRDTIDSFLENHTSLRPHDPDNCDSRRLDFVNPMMEMKLGEGYELSFDCTSDMSLFEDPAVRGKWKENGLIGRNLTLTLGRIYTDNTAKDVIKAVANEHAEGGYSRMWTKFQEFLSVFGEEVWHLSISYHLNSEGGDAWEEIMFPFLTEGIFHSFPNIRTLRIENSSFVFQDAVNPEAPPPAPKLETLVCFGLHSELAMLERYRAQLRKIQLPTDMWTRLDTLADWPNLTELHLNYFLLLRDFDCLLGVGPRMPQLSKLGIHLWKERATEELRLKTGQGLLKVLRHLCSTTRLNTLRLEGGFCGLSMGEDPNFYDTDIRQLTTLEFNNCVDDNSAVDYAFLLRCFPLLENLNVFVRDEPEYYADNDEMRLAPPIGLTLKTRLNCKEWKGSPQLGKELEIVEVNKYVLDGEMYKSNIWELMPLLKVFTFQWDVYTREGFEAYKAMLNKKNEMM